ncbi:MAG: hypothetical protein ACK47C_07825 [Paracoccaceae bacterium]
MDPDHYDAAIWKGGLDGWQRKLASEIDQHAFEKAGTWPTLLFLVGLHFIDRWLPGYGGWRNEILSVGAIAVLAIACFILLERLKRFWKTQLTSELAEFL